MSAPHILAPAELVGDAGKEDEEVLQEEGHTRVGVLWVECFGLIIVDILSKQDVCRTWKAEVDSSCKISENGVDFVWEENQPRRLPKPIMKPKKNQILAPTGPRQPSVNPSPRRRLFETAFTMNIEMVAKTPQRWKTSRVSS